MKFFLSILFCCFGLSALADFTLTINNVGNCLIPVTQYLFTVNGDDGGGRPYNAQNFSINVNSAINPGSSATFTITSIEYTLNGLTYSSMATNTVFVSGGNSPVFNVTMDGCANVECKTNLTFTVNNNDSVSHSYAATYISSVDGSSYQFLAGADAVPPGQTRSVTVEVDCTNVSNVELVRYDPNGSMEDVGGSIYAVGSAPPSVVSTSPTPSSPSSPNPSPTPVNDNSPPLNNYNPTNSFQTGTNAPILFTTTNINDSVQQGDSALYDATVKGFNQNHADLSLVNSSFGEMNTNGVNIASTLAQVQAQDAAFYSNVLNHGLIVSNLNNSTFNGSNLTVNIGTNLSLGTNLASENTLVGISNLLAGSVTNSNSTNFTSGLPTDYSTALGLAQPQVQSSLDAIDTLKGKLTGPVYSDDGDPTMLLATSYGNFDFNPLHDVRVAGVASLAKRLFAWLMVVGYLYLVCKDTVDIIDKLGTRRGSAVQDLDTAGFNVAGVVIALLLPIAALVGWGIVLAVVLTWKIGGGFDVFAIYNANPLSGAATGSIHLAEAFFPLQLMFALVSSYLLFKLTIGRALLLYGAVAKYIFGT
ncbi:MAG TPA: hypothetical protein VIK59_02965 [Verrucomicrobiae bacterium]